LRIKKVVLEIEFRETEAVGWCALRTR